MNKKPAKSQNKPVKPQQKSVNQRGSAPKSARPQNLQKKTPQKPQNQQMGTPKKPQNPQKKTPQNPQNPQRKAPQRTQNQPPRRPNPKADKAITAKRNLPQPQRSRRHDADDLKRQAAAIRRRNPQKRTKRFRGGNYILYYLLAAVVVIIVLIILSNTVLFKCSRIDVTGNVRYKPEDILSVCGIAEGDNLLRVNTANAEKMIADSLVYIDSASVKKHFPTRVELTVTEAVKWYGVEQNGITAAISRGGKVVEHCTPEDFPVVRGMEAESLQTGAWLKSKTDGKAGIPPLLLNAAEKAGLRDITAIDITDKFSIKMVVDGRITLELGSSSEAESKLIIAKSIIDRDIGEDDNVTLLLSNPDKVALRNNQTEMPVQSTTSSASTSAESSELPEESESETSEESE